MPRRSLFCARAPTGLVHWYQPRLGGAHLRPRVRTRRSTERGGGRDSGKSAQLAMFGLTARGQLDVSAKCEYPSKRACFLRIRKRLYRSQPSVRACQGGASVQNKKKGCKPADGRISRWSNPFFRIPRVLFGSEPPKFPPPGRGSVAVEGGENRALLVVDVNFGCRQRTGVALRVVLVTLNLNKRRWLNFPCAVPTERDASLSASAT